MEDFATVALGLLLNLFRRYPLGLTGKLGTSAPTMVKLALCFLLNHLKVHLQLKATAKT